MATDRPGASDVRLLALAAEQGRILAHLLALLHREIPLTSHRRVIAVRRATDTWKQGYELGERARKASLNTTPESSG